MNPPESIPQPSDTSTYANNPNPTPALPSLETHYPANPTVYPTLPFHSPVIPPIPSHFEFAHSPFHDLDTYVLLPDGTLPPSLHYCPHATVKSLPSRQKELVAHCVCLVSEQIVASEGVDVCRWLSIFHLIPRLLLLSSLHKRINTPYTSKFRRTAGGRRIRAPCDLAGDAFETRVRAFLSGRFFELLATSAYDVANYPHLRTRTYSLLT